MIESLKEDDNEELRSHRRAIFFASDCVCPFSPTAEQPAASPQAPTWSPSQDIGMFVFGKSGPDR